MPKKIEVTWKKITDWVALVIVGTICLAIIKGILSSPKAIEACIILGSMGAIIWAFIRAGIILQQKASKKNL